MLPGPARHQPAVIRKYSPIWLASSHPVTHATMTKAQMANKLTVIKQTLAAVPTIETITTRHQPVVEM
ncbi:MAG: hypothetical protein DRI39_05265 [Chloroflexi bacterium]|nr:MAG: hypothetical protein DRI39_05265 [Chloroflexota bacterium]